MNTKVISYLLGKISVLMGLAQVINFAMALYYGEECYREFAISIAFAIALGFGLENHGRDVSHKEISVREGIGTVFFAWVLAAALASIPFVLIGVLDPISAYFEAMSGLTTTGATSISDLEVLPKSLLFWRAMNHWIGGIGIIVIFVALLPQIASGAVYLFNAEVTGFSNSRILPRIRTTAIALFYIYLLLTIILTGILRGMGMSVYDAVYHACSCIATGGFSDYNTSVAHFKSPMIEYALSLFMVLAAGNFAVYYQVTQNGIKALWEDLEFKIYVVMVACFSVAIAVNIILVNGYSIEGGFRSALFHVASFASTTGFVADDYDKWPPFARMMLAVMFFTGGCAGSTAGGIKICRLIVLVKTVAAELRRTLHPQMLLSVYYSKVRLSMATVTNIGRFFFMYIFIVALLTLVTTASGVAPEEAIFGVASCLASVGPAFGSIGATGTYTELPAGAKIAMALGMLLGRLELFTALALLRSEYWRNSKRW
ncbi:MAG: TrkH family potassium uptake protein [Phascolarctobacterium sp.]